MANSSSLGTHFIHWSIADIEAARERMRTRVFVVLKVDFNDPLLSIVNMYHDMDE